MSRKYLRYLQLTEGIYYRKLLLIIIFMIDFETKIYLNHNLKSYSKESFELTFKIFN